METQNALATINLFLFVINYLTLAIPIPIHPCSIIYFIKSNKPLEKEAFENLITRN